MTSQTPQPDILCIGSALWDIIGRAPVPMQCGEDVGGRITRLPGGVALNIAMTLARFGLRPALLTAIGHDAEGDELIRAAAGLGIDCRHVCRTADLPTDRYMAIEGTNGLIAAVADAHSLEQAGARILAPMSDGPLGRASAPWTGPVALDGNLTGPLLAQIAQSPLFGGADLRIVPASPGKVARLLPLLTHPNATLYLNLAEARFLGQRPFDSAAEAAQGLLAQGARRVLVTDGARLVADGAAHDGAAPVLTHAPPPVPVARVTGAGDTFMAAHLVSERQGASRAEALERAVHAATRYVSGEIAP